MPLAPDVDKAWQALDRKVRNQIRKAEKSGLTASVGGSELLMDFYGVFAENMRDLGTPVYPRRFFYEMLTQFPDATRIFIVRHDGKPVAGSITYAFRETMEVPSASSLKAYRAMCPNNLLYWTMIQQAIADGFSTFDFGRSTPGEGTFMFKQQWGAQPGPLCWEYRLLTTQAVPDRNPKNPRFRAAIGIWKRLPLPVTMVAGPPIVRFLP
jgi:FemAB-related protein (PEP-CTERM system-associated)